MACQWVLIINHCLEITKYDMTLMDNPQETRVQSKVLLEVGKQFLEVGKVYISPYYSLESRNQPIIAHKSWMRIVNLSC